MIIKYFNQSLRMCLVGCGFATALVSCSDFLEIQSREEILLEDFWNEKADVDNIVAGCYSGMQAENVIARMIVWGEARSENMMVGHHDPVDGALLNVLTENIKTKNAYTTWDGFYTVINRCNTVIKYAPGVAASDPAYSETELRATIGEVSAIRDLMYFYLIRTFRDVPYTTEAYTDDDQPMDLAPTPFHEVLDSLISDLERVQNYVLKRYPETKPQYQTARITKSAIWAMLCEMYLWKGDYDNCVRYADMVIQDKKDLLTERRGQGLATGAGYTQSNSRFNGFPLIDCRNDAYQQIFIVGNSQETIFELAFDKGDPGYSRLGNSAVGRLYGSSGWSDYVQPSNVVVEDADKTTGRLIYADRNKMLDTRIFMNTTSSGGTNNICKYAYAMLDITSKTTEITGKGVGLYSYAKVDNVEHFRNSTPWIIYRLTDIMLLKAEALCQQMLEGSESSVTTHNKPYREEIFSLVNAVNKRSVYQTTLKDTLVAGDYVTKSQMEDLVMQERHRELMYEGKRWYDLVRRCMRENNTQAVQTAIGRRDGLNAQYVLNTFSSSVTGMWAIFWPYNDEETKVNLNLAAHQNPAFDNGESNIQK